ncbi:ParB N-terminal domain-containing protein [Streptomyces johnsoniae]|uniref:ParB N-terminal domain-containing protein n=1 Tax=Streptomyces johnsoniae TaxID=3075532 RepID=A0ABU2SAL9_9ACTN|nr:ParB N-terminal domain-containing protein [Streptomyces sp. DSM 41886]MDT0445160.1 ParB N-terminal domain-containing protein [Streptomyces sp. DSM 41886]
MGVEPGAYLAEYSGVHPVVRATEPVEEIPVTPVPVAVLRLTDSPRLAGLDIEHVNALAATDNPLPPILVHRPTMRVIDGRHRVRAAVLRGHETIEARLVDGHEHDLFALSVRLNVTHGLPLSTADRTAAVRRLLGSHPQWSDRAIGHITGLSAKSVASIRRRASGDAAQLAGRVGRDGRTRPLNAAQGRLLASRLIRERPAASLREIAREAAISIGTAHDVRRRLTSGQHPVPAGLRRRQATARIEPPEPTAHRAAQAPRPPRGAPVTPHDAVSAAAAGNQEDGAGAKELLRKLKRDPSLRFSEAGRSILRLMDAHSVPSATWQRLAEAVPAHCTGLVAAAARECAASWLAFAQRVERRGEQRGPRRGPEDH